MDNIIQSIKNIPFKDAGDVLNIVKILLGTQNFSVVLTDPSARVVYANDVFYKRFGYMPDEIVGRTLGPILQGENTSQEMSEYLREKIKKKESVSCDILNYTKDGEEIYQRLDISPVFKNDEHIGFIGIQTDITDAYIENRILQESIEKKDILIRSITHEIKNMLNTISMSAEILGSKNIENELITNYSQIIKDQSRKTSLMLEKLLVSFSSLENDKSVFNYMDITQELYDMNSETLKLKNIDFEVDILGNNRLETYREELILVLNSFLSNAIKFSIPKSKIIIALEKINNNRTQIKIKDFGIGMSKKTKNNLFKNVPNKSMVGTSGEVGSGLGMIIANMIIKSNCWEVSVESEENKGTEITLLI